MPESIRQEYNPLVSIVVTCYNRADMVCTALDSVWNQTYRPLELIIVDDGSKDNSMEVIEDWVRRHPDGNGFSSIAKSFSNGKLCVARNRGLELSHGELIQYVDDDDWLYPFAVAEKVRGFTEQPDCDVIVNQVDYNYPGIGIRGHSALIVPEDKAAQLGHVLNPCEETYFSSTLMFRRQPLIDCGAWTPGLLFADDIDVVVRIALHGAKFGLVDKPLSVYNMHGELRQCNHMIYRLADDFWSKLFTDLAECARRCGRDSAEVRAALAEMVSFYGLRQLRIGRFTAAELCWNTAAAIGGVGNWRMKLPKFARKLEFGTEYAGCVAKQGVKRAVKRLLGRGC